MAQAPAQQLITEFEDSRRWRNIARRHGDIIISAPPGSAAVWMQRIVAAMLWPAGDAPGLLNELSPWVDERATPIESLAERLDAQAHRRFLLTYSPGDCTPLDDRCRYVVVYGSAPLEYSHATTSPSRHLASWWPRRHLPNVLFVHARDLDDDLAGEVNRVATFLDIEIDDSHRSPVIEACAVNSSHRGVDADLVSEGEFESPNSLAAKWLQQGSTSLGLRPEDTGAPPPPIATGPRNPMYARVKKQTSNSVQAISERRVDQAREDGLFDNLALHGKPIPDIDRHRRPGWWAQRFVKSERNKVTALQLEDELRQAMPALWRLENEEYVQRRVRELNERIVTYNKVTTLEPMAHLDLAATLATWRDLRHRR